MMRFFLIIAWFILFGNLNRAQDSVEVSLSADLVSRYVWRGFDVGNSPNIQPLITTNYKNFEVGLWGSYAFTEEATKFDELNLWLFYTINTGSGYKLKLSIIDYYFPNDGKKLGNFNNFNHPDGNGAHLLNLGVSATGPESFPFTFAANINVHNDSGHNSYFELSYPFSLNNYNIDLFCGVTPGSKKNTNYYMTDKFSLINLGFRIEREIKISEYFSVPVFSVFSVNPSLENSYLVFGITL